MIHKSTLLGTLAYTLVAFPLAVIWHVVLFEDKYHSFGYFEGEPNFALGLLTIIIQGYILSLLYSYVKFKGQGIIRGLKYALIIGIFFWSSHVLAFVAKQVVDNSLSFVVMESFYLLIQFGAYGLLIGKIYGRGTEHNA
ncbi:MAG: hypothetical protein IH855_03035 [Bacteroidetes bacterium]|nr:hypothetical protein [Bacteroidota bacterium]